MTIEEVVNAEIELLTAIKKADVSTLEKILHDDLLFNLPDGNTITKEFDLDSYRSGKMKIDTLEALDQNINIIDNVAVVAVTVSLKGAFGDFAIDGAFRYIRVWKQFDGILKVIAGSCVQLA
ncbi:nuclear transport factor 2 family protein [Flavobacterium sp. KACC 22761]|uniref:nuclear transport factor 2 family protein n=1 Tax=Flavobacterium sp. KACC 22761 TaxID=3092665 RepID=UPI002A757E28|nr:nuclear transport factor 2 family protein [Flavobacterium sp. KACC 22761]WPO79706.1 nuclear transport factor 2 family protein [Flavobacterium sp. KACC 22761]